MLRCSQLLSCLKTQWIGPQYQDYLCVVWHVEAGFS